MVQVITCRTILISPRELTLMPAGLTHVSVSDTMEGFLEYNGQQGFHSAHLANRCRCCYGHNCRCWMHRNSETAVMGHDYCMMSLILVFLRNVP